MRGMKHAILFVLFGMMGVSASFAQEATATADNQTTITRNVNDNAGWFEDDENYTKSLAFKKQVAITQIATGSVFVPSGLAMIAVGTHKMNVADRLASNSEGIEEDAVMGRKAGIIMIATGSVTSVAGALLMMKGCETMKQIKNRQGEVVGEVGLSNSGIIGVGVKF